MARDAVANVVYRLGERGYPPRKVGKDSWESRCPVHRGSDYSLSITRNEFNHVVLECRTAENCQHLPGSDVPRWLSDALSQLVFGGAVSGRALFTNDDRSFIYAQRPVLLSGIGDFVRWADLKDRCVFMRLPPIPPTRCRGEDEFWNAFQADRPAILGAVLDAMVGGLRELPSVHLAELPRMADYAIWGEAVGRGLGWEPGTFLSTYTDNRKEATLTDLLDSPLGNLLLRVAHKITGLAGTPARLHASLTRIVGKKVAASADWPKTSEKLGCELRRLAPQLRMHGMSVSFERRNDGRIITLRSERVPIAPPARGGTDSEPT